MSIEKMTVVDLTGKLETVDNVLIHCAASGLFQPENAAKRSEYSVGTSLAEPNPYSEVAAQLGEWNTQPPPVHWQELASTCAQVVPQAFVAEAQQFLLQLKSTSFPGKDGEDATPDKMITASMMQELYLWQAKANLLYQAFDLRKYAVRIRDVFHVFGFVTTRTQAAFCKLFEEMENVELVAKAADPEDTSLTIPVKLRNNWLARPFEMFVEMYGMPSYNDIDPTPFVAYSYSLLFGVMFGDLGQGLLISLIGLLLWRLKKMQLGAVLSRIGIVSGVFGFLYGSVFGYEHLLDPFYKNVLGLAEKPLEVMHPATTNLLLMSAIALGVCLILIVLVFNICVGIRQKNFTRAILSQNGIAGLVFYGGAIAAALLSFTKTAPVPLALKILLGVSLVVIFLKEPIAHLLELTSATTIIDKTEDLKGSKKYRRNEFDLRNLFTGQYLIARFGRLPIGSYEKLHFYEDSPFVVHPLKTDIHYVWCVYNTAKAHKAEIDAIFHDLYFERIYIPAESLVSNQAAESFIRRCIETGGLPSDVESNPKYEPAKVIKHPTLWQTMFPEGLGGFLTETVFEMFEVLLSFITNTMSFLRVGGFILSHAGMMSVVMTLSQMVGSGASPIVIVVGNLFVMALEGLIVGIQALRLEFYEMFSRFFEAGGEGFQPISMQEKTSK